MDFMTIREYPWISMDIKKLQTKKILHIFKIKNEDDDIVILFYVHSDNANTYQPKCLLYDFD